MPRGSAIPGFGANPAGLPPGLGTGSGVPRSNGALNGASENTGNAAGLIGALINAGGGKPKGPGGGGLRSLEKPTLARSAAISRRLGGNPSRGTEVKGL